MYASEVIFDMLKEHGYYVGDYGSNRIIYKDVERRRELCLIGCFECKIVIVSNMSDTTTIDLRDPRSLERLLELLDEYAREGVRLIPHVRNYMAL